LLVFSFISRFLSNYIYHVGSGLSVSRADARKDYERFVLKQQQQQPAVKVDRVSGRSTVTTARRTPGTKTPSNKHTAISDRYRHICRSTPRMRRRAYCSSLTRGVDVLWCVHMVGAAVALALGIQSVREPHAAGVCARARARVFS
jgi:hypothetical protein